MSARPQTTFAGTAGNPFGMRAKDAAKKSTPSLKVVDKLKLTIHSDPLPGREKPPGKYDELFAQMEPGQNIRCSPKQVCALRNALRTWLTLHNYPGSVRQETLGKDGLGRVWWLAGTPLQIYGEDIDTSKSPKS